MITSLALGKVYDCPIASEIALKDMGKYIIVDYRDKDIFPPIFSGYRNFNWPFDNPWWRY